ncbi:MAG: L-fucose:H+ symporter permease [Muribaculaceae bacterium]|nr:L-fucose:H+ symporter permease [Muribaculaceae bacterium]
MGKLIDKKLLLPFILITACFSLWGFANDITNPMVEAFSRIFNTSVTQATLVQVAFYGGYFAMALPAAFFLRKYDYKWGVLMGLGLYAIGAFLFFPAKATGNFYPFLAAYFIMTCGLSFLETSCNPYILVMGDHSSATRRLNLAQAFNPIGSLSGMFVAMYCIQNQLDPIDKDSRAMLPVNQFEAVKEHDLSVLIGPYLFIGLVILVLFLVIFFMKMPKEDVKESKGGSSASASWGRLLRNREYVCGVIAQFFYVGVQIMCWTFIIQYGKRIFMGEGIAEGEASSMAQKYNIIAMCLFCCSRFICTFLMRFVNAGRLLGILAVAGGALVLGVIFIDGRVGLWCLVCVSACMSLMFPTIYGIALGKVSMEDAKFGAAGLIMSILGGSVLPPLQSLIIDQKTVLGLPAENASFVVPFICFIVVAVYGFVMVKHLRSSN